MFQNNFFWSAPKSRKRSNSARKRFQPARKLYRRIARGLGFGLLGLGAALFLLILLLRWVPVPTSAFMLSHHLQGAPVTYAWVPLQAIAPSMPIAVVASEDQRFVLHRGFDFDAIADAMAENRRRLRPRGASTISQQVAKNLFLWPRSSWLRKGLETGLTVTIELCWSKRRILEVYLNIAQFGPGIFGVAAASRHYFDIPPSQLDGRQAALLAAILPSPDRYTIKPPSPYMLQRSLQIQEQVRLLGGPDYLSILKPN
jgi:monofunctional glycosyltransferase